MARVEPEIVVRMCESTVRESAVGPPTRLEHVVALRAPRRMRVCVARAHFPDAPNDMRWRLSWSVLADPHAQQTRTTFAGYPAVLPEAIDVGASPCVLDMDLNVPWYNAIFLECERAGGAVPCAPGRGWFVDLAFEPHVPPAAALPAAPPPAVRFRCPHCAHPYAYASEAGLQRHVANCRPRA